MLTQMRFLRLDLQNLPLLSLRQFLKLRIENSAANTTMRLDNAVFCQNGLVEHADPLQYSPTNYVDKTRLVVYLLTRMPFLVLPQFQSNILHC